MLDKKLTFKQHIEDTRRKAHATKQIIEPYIQKITPLPEKRKIEIYGAYIKSLILYVGPAWSSASKSNLKRLQVIENYCLRGILGLKRIDNRNQESEVKSKK